MFPVCQVYTAGFERHGSGKYVPVRRYSQYDGIEWIAIVHFTEDNVTGLGIQTPYLMKLRQCAEHHFR